MEMLLEILIGIVVSIFIGAITGIIPGIHSNLLATIVVSLAPLFLSILNPLTAAMVIMTLAITHLFVSAIPAVLLGVPDSDKIVTMLPNHRLLVEGRGHEAIVLNSAGTLAGILASCTAGILFIQLIGKVYENIEWLIGWILIGITIMLIAREKGNKKWWAIIVFLLSGVLGMLVLTKTEVKNPLFPLLSGLFGIASLITSYSSSAKIPAQTEEIKKTNPNRMIKAVLNATVTGSIFSVLPGVGPSQAAILATSKKKKTTTREFLVLSAGLNAANFIISVLTLYALNKARNGAVASVGELIGPIGGKEVLIFIAAIWCSLGCIIYLTAKIARISIRVVSRINYKKICRGVFCFLAIMIFVLSGWLGVYIAIVATAIGIIPQWKNIGRHHAMGSLLLPVILFFIL